MTLECTNCLRPPRTSQTPSSGSCQCSASHLINWRAMVARAGPVACRARAPGRSASIELAVDVELQLSRCGVADTDRRRALVPVEVRQLVLVEPPLAAEPVHDLDVLGVAGDRAHDPVAPARRFLDVPGGHERVQGQRRVAEPAEPVVPVAHAAEELRQRRGRRGDDPAGRLEREGLQRDQGTLDFVGPATLVGGSLRPRAPPVIGLLDDGERVDRSCVDSHDGCELSTNPIRSPSRTEKSAVTWKSCARSGTCPRSSTAFGPAPASTASPTLGSMAWSARSRTVAT